MAKNFKTDEPLPSLLKSHELADLLTLSNREREDLSAMSSPEVMQLALKYAQLASLPCLSEEEANCLGEILAIADHSELLSFWIVGIDHYLGHRLGLLDEDNCKSYEDQQALLRDYIGVMENFPIPKDRQITDFMPPLRSDLYSRDDEAISC